jgi:hypothetical protein
LSAERAKRLNKAQDQRIRRLVSLGPGAAASEMGAATDFGPGIGLLGRSPEVPCSAEFIPCSGRIVTPKHPLLFGGRGGFGEAAARTKANRIANEQESTEAIRATRDHFSREMGGVLGSYAA